MTEEEHASDHIDSNCNHSTSTFAIRDQRGIRDTVLIRIFLGDQ